jgi:hypothetical protein
MRAQANSDPILLNCPYCSRRMASITDHGYAVYRCGLHGQFWIDAAGNLRETPRA